MITFFFWGGVYKGKELEKGDLAVYFGDGGKVHRDQVQKPPSSTWTQNVNVDQVDSDVHLISLQLVGALACLNCKAV